MFITIKGGATVAKVVGTISLAPLTKKNLTPTFCLPGGGDMKQNIAHVSLL